METCKSLTEASYYGILFTPTLLMVDSEGEEITRMTGNELIKDRV